MTATASGQPEFSRPTGRPVPRVLVVEDQPQLLRALRINLRARQYEVLTAKHRPGGAWPSRRPARRTR